MTESETRMPTATEVRDIPWSDVAAQFTLTADPGTVPLWQLDPDTYAIAVVAQTGSGVDGFRCAADGVVLSAPRGHAKDFRPGRITGLVDAAANLLREQAGVSVQQTAIADDVSPVRLIQEDLVAIATHIHGDDPRLYAFACYFCGDVATIQEFIDAGADPGRAGQECIGRHLCALEPSYTGRGCPGVSFGLIPGPWEVIFADTSGRVRSMRTFAVADQPRPTARTWTQNVKTTAGTRVRVKMACNGCGLLLGDMTEAEGDRAVIGEPPLDVTGECPTCTPVVTA